MLDSVSTSSNSSKTLLQQKIDDFNNGKVNITKSDLKQYVEEKKLPERRFLKKFRILLIRMKKLI